MPDENAKLDINNFPTILGVDTSGNVKLIKVNGEGSMNVGFIDSAGRELLLESNNAIPINVQDQHSEPIDLYFCRTVLTTNPTSAENIDSKTVTVASVVGASVGDCINILENGRLFQALVQDITDSTITFNCPLDMAITTSAIVKVSKWNMNVDGSTTSSIYKIKPPTGVMWDINRIIVGMLDDVAMDDSKFGGITALTNGVVFRQLNHINKNLFVVSDNGGFRERSFDAQYLAKAPAGVYGFGVRKTFNGQDKSGVSIRLDGDNGDELEIIIQDNLTALTKFACVAQGHVVID